MTRPLSFLLLVSLLCCSILLTTTASSPFRPSARRHGSTTRLSELVKAISPTPTPSAPVATTLFPRLLPSWPLAANDSNYTYCNTCIALSQYIAPLVNNQVALEAIELAAIGYCVTTKAEGQCSGTIECVQLCKGIIGEWAPIIVKIYSNTSLSSQAICYDLGECPAPAPPTPFPGVPVPSNITDLTGQKKWPFWSQTTGTGTILHLSDLHYDLQYSAGALTKCSLPLCCRESEGPGTNASNTAGVFGDFNCDSPPLLVSTLFDYLNRTLSPRPDFILYTGDDPAHDVWAQTRTSNLAVIQWVSQELQRFFPDVPVFSAIGNHEVCPVNLFGGPSVDNWLYSELVQYWSYYLPQQAQQTLNYGGYFAALVRPGLYVISINTNIYTGDDMYVNAKNPIDLSSQLNWLNNTLYQIQQVNGRAIIIGHSSPIDWYDTFSSTFNDYLAHYNATILNLFFGHTHHNQVQLYHTDDTLTPHAVGYVGGSVTPYTNVNPGFAVYSHDRSLSLPYLVTDFNLHWLNLSDANAKKAADWSPVRISAQADYGLSSLAPSQWYNLTEAIRTGGAADVYEKLQVAWNKGLYTGGQGSLQDRQSLACEMENDQDSAASRCRQRFGIVRGSAAWPFPIPHLFASCTSKAGKGAEELPLSQMLKDIHQAKAKDAREALEASLNARLRVQ